MNSCLPLFFWADSSSTPHLSFYCNSTKFLFPAPPLTVFGACFGTHPWRTAIVLSQTVSEGDFDPELLLV